MTCCLIGLISFASIPAYAQDSIVPIDNDSLGRHHQNIADSSLLTAEDSAAIYTLTKKDSALIDQKLLVTPFSPNPTKAVIYSAICPGLGQIYNRKYWKLPLVYGGFMGFIYAITWNNKNYQDYTQAYRDIMTDDVSKPETWHQSWQDFVAAGKDPADYIVDENFKRRLKSGKDYYRRYRDLSIILTVGWYLICMADAYVDAQLFNFDISPDLSMKMEPSFIPSTNYSSRTYGLNCSITF